MFFRIEDEFYNLNTVANITFTHHKKTMLKKLNLDHEHFAVVRIVFLKEYKIPHLTFYADFDSVAQMMYDFERYKKRVHEFIVLQIPDMKKLNEKAKEKEEEDQRER